MLRVGALVLIAACFAAGVSASARAAFPGTNAKIVFLDESGAVETYDPASKAIALVFPADPGRPRQDPAWAADGRTIAWTENSGLPDGDAPAILTRVLLADGLTTAPLSSYRSVWSLDGRVGGSSVDSTSHDTSLSHVDAWSPDGTEYASRATTWIGSSVDSTLAVSDADGSNPRAIVDFGEDGGYCGSDDNVGVDWSPDGTRLAYCTHDALHIVAADGSSDRELSGHLDFSRPSWSPDGTQIVFETSGDSFRPLAVVDANLTHFHVLVTSDGQAFAGADPDWGRAPLPKPHVPVNTSPPSIGGPAPQVQERLTADPGTWSGDTYRFFTYAWQRCESTTECSDIPGATMKTYFPVPDDIGKRLRVEVTAVSGEGKAFAFSSATSAIPTPAGWPPAFIPPSIVSLPKITGRLAVGATLTVSPGTYDGAKPLKPSYAWYRCSVDGTFCTTLDRLDYGPPCCNAYGPTHLVDPDDAGTRLEVLVRVTYDGTMFDEGTWSAPTALISPVGPAVSNASLAWDGGSIRLAFHLCDPTSGTQTVGATDTIFPRTRTTPATYSWTLPWSGGCQDVVRSWPATPSAGSRHQVAFTVTDALGVSTSDNATLDG